MWHIDMVQKTYQALPNINYKKSLIELFPPSLNKNTIMIFVPRLQYFVIGKNNEKKGSFLAWLIFSPIFAKTPISLKFRINPFFLNLFYLILVLGEKAKSL